MKSILITGCRRGIGLEFVKELSLLKTDPEIIIATCRDLNNAAELQEYAKRDKRIHLLELDSLNYDQFDEFAKKVEKIVGDRGLNVLLHNAGILNSDKKGTIEGVNGDSLIEVYKTNTVAPILLTKALLPLLRKAGKASEDMAMGSNRAAIVSVSSFLGSHQLNDRSGCWGYRESKSALNMAMCSLKVELEKDGIMTFMLHPGWVQTDMGGEGAQVSVQKSVQSMIGLIQNLDVSKNGTFLRFDGTAIPW